jgi:hypothetical protein
MAQKQMDLMNPDLVPCPQHWCQEMNLFLRGLIVILVISLPALIVKVFLTAFFGENVKIKWLNAFKETINITGQCFL